MTGQERRDAIIKILKESEKPLSGTDLARELAVSRQVIVQDMISMVNLNGYQLV